MGTCKLCGKPAGFLRRVHPECEMQCQVQEKKIKSEADMIVAETIRVIKDDEPFHVLENKITHIERSYSVPSESIRKMLIKGWEHAVKEYMEGENLNDDSESRFIDFLEYFAIQPDELNSSDTMTKLFKISVLRGVLNGVLPPPDSFGGLPINLQRNESIVWAFPNSKYHEDKSRRRYVGGSHGVSIRIMKGVYYRMGAFKGQPQEYTERVHIDTGWVVITNKNIYFAGPKKSLRLPYPKIVSIEPFSDGIGVTRDSSTAKPQIFITEDGWFTYNLVTNLSQMPNLVANPTPTTHAVKRKDGSVAHGAQSSEAEGENTEMLRVYREAAKAGDVESQLRLAYMFGEGVGTSQNMEQAAYWYEEAARRKNRLAQFQLGALYAQGKGVELSSPKAFVWWLLAAAQGDETAAKNAIVLMRKMTDIENDEAQNLMKKEMTQEEIDAALEAIKTKWSSG